MTEAPGHAPSGDPPGLTRFTIEGRAAPALFVAGWLATLAGAVLTTIAVLSAGGLAGGVLFTIGLGLLAAGLVAAAGSQALERRAAGVAGYAGPSPVLVFAACLPITFVLVILVGTPLVGFGLDPKGPGAALVSVSASAVAYVAAIGLVVVGTGSLRWRDMGLRRSLPGAVEDLVWGAVLAVPVLFATGLLGLVLSQFFPIPPSILPPAPDLAGFAMNLAAASLVAAVGEELFFRGFATTAWARRFGFRGALVRGALFFALAHVLTIGGTTAAEGLGLAAFAFLARLPVAFALGWLFLRRGSIYAPIGLHAAFNGLQVLALASAGTAVAG